MSTQFALPQGRGRRFTRRDSSTSPWQSSCLSPSVSPSRSGERRYNLGVGQTRDVSATTKRRFGRAWLVLTVVLALHVADEALNDFLRYYNPYAERLSESWPWLTLPVFSFPIWISLLITAVVSLALMSLCAYRTFFWTPFAATVYSVVMFANGFLHLAAALRTGSAIPGVYTAPLCMVGALYLWREAHRVKRERRQGS